MAIEKTFLDRVPTYPGRVKLAHVSGDLYDMERADEPVVAGTPLDKAAFDSIVQSRLTGRYYMPTVTRTIKNSQTGLTANPVPTSWTRVSDNNYVSGDYKITSSTRRSGGGDVLNAFDGLNDTSWSSSQNASTDYVMVELPVPVTVKRIKMRCFVVDASGGGSISTVTVQGSNDGSNWTDLRVVNGAQTEALEYDLTTTGAFEFYRLLISRTGTAIVGCGAFEFSLYDVATYSNEYALTAGVPNEWATYQKLTIQTPTNTAVIAVIENSLNGIPITTILQANRRYELRYANGLFWAKEV